MKTPGKTSRGMILLIITVTAWGLMYPASKNATDAGIDGYYLSAIRYGLGCILVSSILFATEGTKSFSFENKKIKIWIIGTIGFCGLNFFTFTGINKSTAEHAAIILALMPMLSIILSWIIKKQRPATHTLACTLCAFTGITLVICKGEGWSSDNITHLQGDCLLLLGTVCWVIYTYHASCLSGWSALRITAMSSLMGTLSILLLTLLLTCYDIASPPSLHTVMSVIPELAILVLSTAVIVSWNSGIKQIGLVNGMLFVNLVPVITFSIGLLKNNSITLAEITGAVITTAALTANNILSRTPPLATATSR